MNNTYLEAFKIVNELRFATFSTIDLKGNPHSRIIEVVHSNEDGLYFITLTAKPFYRQLSLKNKVSITGITKDFLQIRINGQVEEVDSTSLDGIFHKNHKLRSRLPEEKKNLYRVFRIFRGRGEVYTLGINPKVKRIRFAFGGEKVNKSGCIITEKCLQCDRCKQVCPFGAIEEGKPYKVIPELCDECGFCYSVCPVSAIELPLGL